MAAEGKTLNADEFFFSDHKFELLNGTLLFPPGLQSSTLTQNLRNLVINPQELLNRIDERKEAYRGHADCIRMARSGPCLWTVQACFQVANSWVPFIHSMRPLDQPKSSGLDPNKFNLVDFCNTRTDSDETLSPAAVYDSFYNPRGMAEHQTERGAFFLASVNKQWSTRV